jgi:hypothetical protein
MSFQTGTSANGNDLLQKLVTWLASLGWNVDMSASDQGNGGWRAHLDKSGLFVHLKAAFPGDTSWASSYTTAGWALQLYLSTAFSAGAAFNAQPGNPPYANGSSQVVGVGANLSIGPFANYYFFSDPTDDHIVVVIETAPGVYTHIGWGPSLVKNGAWTGGAYFFGSSAGYFASAPALGALPGYGLTSFCPGAHQDATGAAAGFVLCNSDSWVGLWIAISHTTTPAWGYTGRGGGSSVYGSSFITASIPRYSTSRSNSNLQEVQTSVLDGRANLLPVLWWVGRDGSSGISGGFSPVGTIPTVFATTGVGNGFGAGEDYLLGSDTYTMFPDFAVHKVV